MTRLEIKEEAKKNLDGRWGNAALYVLLYALLIGFCSWIMKFIPVIGPIAYSILSVVVAYNILIAFIEFKRGGELNITDVITKIPENFVPAWKCVGGVLLKMLPYVIIIVVLYVALFFTVIVTAIGAFGYSRYVTLTTAGVGAVVAISIALFVVGILATIKGLYYVFTQYIMYDSGNTLTGREAAAKSEELMNGKRGKYFIFVLSFIGWAILVPFTIGIGMLWLMPYIQVATVVFYESLTGGKKEKPTPVSDDSNPAETAE